MLKLNAFDTVTKHENGFKVELCLPNGEPAFLDCDAKIPKKRLSITIKGSQCSQAKNEMLKVYREVERLKSLGDDELEKEKQKEREMTYEEAIEKQSRKLAKLTVSWENIPDDEGGEILEFNEENAFNLYNKYPDIRDQITAEHNNDENFI